MLWGISGGKGGCGGNQHHGRHRHNWTVVSESEKVNPATGRSQPVDPEPVQDGSQPRDCHGTAELW
jgi:hypothetical protein